MSPPSDTQPRRPTGRADALLFGALRTERQRMSARKGLYELLLP